MTTKQRFCITLAVAGGVLLCALLLGLLYGGADLTLRDVLTGLFSKKEKTLSIILRAIRLPRVMGGVLAGVGLSVSGVLLQSVTDNALAGPSVIGVNSGAGLAMMLTLFLAPALTFLSPIIAFLGAFGAAVCIVAISSRLPGAKVTPVLVGLALSTLCNAVISFFSLLDSEVLVSYNYFSIGGLSGLRGEALWLPFGMILCCFVLSMILAPKVSALSLGEGAARGLGISVRRLRMVCLIIAAASAAAVVSFAGLLGFVGLIVPHIARKLVGHQVQYLLPTAALVGASLVVLADLAGRTWFAPSEIPVGIVMALLGAPFFLVLLLRRGGYAAV